MLELTIASPAEALPSLPNEADADLVVWRDHAGAICAYGGTSGADHWIQLPGVAAFRFKAGGAVVAAVPEGPVEPSVVRDAFQRTVLPLALQALGREVLHASAVRVANGVIAFCATSRTGKSTVAYWLSRRGHALWADDAVCFEIADRAVVALPLPFALQLREPSAAFFAGDGPAVTDTSVDEGPAPLAAAFVLRRTGEGESGGVRRLSAAEAFPVILAHAYCFSLEDAERKRRMMRAYLELTSRMPAFELALEGPLERLSETLALVEDAVGQASDAAA